MLFLTILESDVGFEEERVYEVHVWAEVHRLFEVEGLSKARIGERLEMSRNTVAKLLAAVEPPRYQRKLSGSKLDPFKGSIQVMLGEDARAPATVILERLRLEGYDGGVTILKNYLTEVRPLFVGARAFQRTWYLPGEIGQCDWWEPPLVIPVGKGVHRQVYGLVTTLPHSAAHACVFSFSKQMVDFLPAFSGCLQRFGGVPEKMVVDRDSAIVVPHSRPVRLHDEIAALFGAFRIRPVILKPRRPESKGQVERTNGYLNVVSSRCAGSQVWRICRLNTMNGLVRLLSLGITGGWERGLATLSWWRRVSSTLSLTSCPTRTVTQRSGWPKTDSAGLVTLTIRCHPDTGAVVSGSVLHGSRWSSSPKAERSPGTAVRMSPPMLSSPVSTPGPCG